MAGKKKEIAALPCNFDRHKKGDDLIRQELQKLLEVHREGGAILTEEGRVTLKDPKSKQTYTGLLWSQILDRAPSYFANKHTKVRNRELYGKTLHAEFVKMNKSRVVPEQQTFIIFSRIVWHIFLNHFFDFFCDQIWLADFSGLSRQDFLKCIHEIPLGTVGTVSEMAAGASRSTSSRARSAGA